MMEPKRSMILQSLFFGGFFFVGLNVFQILFRDEVVVGQNAAVAFIGFIFYLLFTWLDVRRKNK